MSFPSLSAALGLSGSTLRLRPHESNHKPHIVLRRVEYPDDEDDEDGDPNVAYFSFFAAKRIDVKPGKELLLMVDFEDNVSGDEELKNRPLMLEGDVAPIANVTAEGALLESHSPEHPVNASMLADVEPLAKAMPVHLRKTWKPPGCTCRGEIFVHLTDEYLNTTCSEMQPIKP
jgi:hypothetical protein